MKFLPSQLAVGQIANHDEPDHGCEEVSLTKEISGSTLNLAAFEYQNS